MTDHSDATVLTELSNALANAVEKAAESIVTVKARRRLPGSGVAWAADVIVTANHIVERDEDITMGLPDGTEKTATLVGRDQGSDLAVLRLAGGSLTPAERAPDGSARVGHMVLAVGRPSSDGPTASSGVISVVGGPWRSFAGAQVEGYIRADLTLYPGFSGGPLVDSAGRVVGINSSHLGRGAGLSLPINAVSRITDALLKGGRIKRGYLGIGNQPVRLPAGLAERVGGQESGLLIVSVEAGTPADKAGLLVGDIVISLGGNKVQDTDDLQNALGPESVGKTEKLGVLRGGEPTELSITIGERS
ncbi:MAG: trypsin-like peptidase domain-containing protein [Dehalococcoidia bacterium]